MGPAFAITSLEWNALASGTAPSITIFFRKHMKEVERGYLDWRVGPNEGDSTTLMKSEQPLRLP